MSTNVPSSVESKAGSAESKTLYQTLDLASTASQDEIEEQYQRLVRLYEPNKLDDVDDQAYAQEKLSEIEAAHRVLSDPEQRREYDREVLGIAPAAESGGGVAEPIDEDTVFYCANHPDRETLLRCNKCGKPICMQCAVQTPVGYRCRECVREQQTVYFNAASQDNVIAFGVGFLVSLIAAPILGVLIGSLGLFIGLLIALFAGSGAGSALAQIIRRSVGRRRGRRLPAFAISGIILGVLVAALLAAFILGISLFSLSMLVFTVLAISTAYAQLR